MESSAAYARRRRELTEQGRRVHGRALALLRSLLGPRVEDAGAEPPAEEPEGLDEVDVSPSSDLRTLDGQLAILGGLMREQLRDPGEQLSPADVADVSETLHELHSVRFGVHDLLGHERLRRLDQLDRGLSELRRNSDQDSLLEVVCETAAQACGFDRVMMSRVDDGVWQPWHSWARQIGEVEERFLRWMREERPRIQLSRMMLERELVRSRSAGIVEDAATDPRVYPPLREAANQHSFVAAPIVVDDRVIGLLHADNPGGEVVDLDREILWFFAIGFAQIFERAVLLARLRDQRAEISQAMSSVAAVLDDLASTEIELATREEGDALSASRPVRPAFTQRSPALEHVLSNREREVLALMATGATNDRIAQQLVVATGTVKSHVKQILRKLEVENRAEAISRYLQLTIGARED